MKDDVLACRPGPQVCEGDTGVCTSLSENIAVVDCDYKCGSQQHFDPDHIRTLSTSLIKVRYTCKDFNFKFEAWLDPKRERRRLKISCFQNGFNKRVFVERY